MFASKSLFTAEQIKQIEASIKSAEENTSGEIRVYVDGRCKEDDVVKYAQQVFHKTGMNKTVLANGVLFYFAIKDRQFAVIGDKAIHQNVTPAFWTLLRDIMQKQFAQGKFTEGLCEAIEKAGIELKKYFPLSSSDKNELPNEIIFGNK